MSYHALTDMTRMEARYVLDIKPIGPLFFSYILSFLHPEFQHRENELRMNAARVYQECTRATLLAITDDASEFHLNLLLIPNWDYFADLLSFNGMNARNAFATSFREFAFHLYHILREQVGIHPGMDYLLDNVAPDYIVFCTFRATVVQPMFQHVAGMPHMTFQIPEVP